MTFDEKLEAMARSGCAFNREKRAKRNMKAHIGNRQFRRLYKDSYCLRDFGYPLSEFNWEFKLENLHFAS